MVSVSPSPPSHQFSQPEVEGFLRDGYVIVRGLVSESDVKKMRQVTEIGLRDHVEPVEYEAELRYPGAPPSTDAEGGRTIRRLKQAHSRSFLFTEWMIRPEILNRLRQLLGPRVVCPLAHHNCIMTKQPRYSAALIETKQFVSLKPGDVLFFHCRTLHAASRNSTNETKYSAVFTFRSADNEPLPGTRSATLPELILTPGVH